MPGEPRSIARRSLLAAVALATLPVRATLLDTSWIDRERGRELPLRIRWPQSGPPWPLLLYSHGLGGSRDGADVWGRAWSEAGFVRQSSSARCRGRSWC